MAFRDRIEVVIDFVTTGAQTSLQKLRTDVAAADTATGKAKAGFTAMGGAISQYGAQAALAAGAALVTFGVKSVQAFQNTTLAVDKFSTATGASLEEASRLKGLSDELGISFETLQSSAIRMNSAVANGTFEKLGLEAQYAADGSLNVNATLVETITTIGALGSAEERTDAARRVFGKNFADMSRLMELSADDLYQKLEDHPDWEITTEEDAANAKELATAMDTLGDTVAEVQLIVARGLVPALTDVVETATAVREGLRDLGDTAEDALGTKVWNGIKDGVGDFAKQFYNPIGWLKDGFNEVRWAVDNVADGNFDPLINSGYEASDAMTEFEARAEYVQSRMAALVNGTEVLADETDDLTAATDAAAESTEAAAKTHEDLTAALKDQYDAARNATDATIAYEDSVIDLESSVDDYRQSLVEANADGEITREELLNLAGAHNDLKGDVLDSAAAFAEAQGATEGSTEAAKLQIEELERLKQKFPELAPFIDGHIAKLNAIPRNINTQLTVTDFDPEGGGNTVRGGGAMSLVGGAIMAANGLTQAAVNWWAGRQNAEGSGGSSQSVKATQRAKFDAEFKLARAKYERGTYTIPEYLVELRRLQRVYDWPKHSDPGMAIWREIERAEKDRREAMKPGGGPGGPDRPVREPGGPDGPSGTGRSGRMGGGTTGGTGGSGGVTVVLNAPRALMVDRRALDEFAQMVTPAVMRETKRIRNGAG
jgi:predicted  nucleic acid-binding Zn-ribbon protein